MNKTIKDPHPLLSDSNIRHELLGLEAMLCPFIQNISSQRSDMFASNITQALNVNGCEPPMIQTGYESIIGNYEFNIPDDIDMQIIDIIPKFKTHFGALQVRKCPSHTVVYKDLNTNKLGYFNLEDYTVLSHGFGYKNKHLNKHLLRKDSYIPKGTILTTSPSHQGSMYAQGVNANVAFIEMGEPTDDAFIISDRLAKKTSHIGINTIKINLKEDDIPLNLYGDEDEYKIHPDIDEAINPDGIIMGIRSTNESSYISDTTKKALMQPQYSHDKLFVAPAGSVVVDISLYCSSKTYRRLNENSDGPYSQLLKYLKHHDAYYNSVLELYETIKKEGGTIADSNFNNLINRCMHLKLSRSNEEARKAVQLMDKRDPIDFITMEITFAYPRNVAEGFKFTGRDGASPKWYGLSSKTN